MNECQAQALETAVFAGDILLESGAEIFRVEDTILRIAKAYGIQSCNTFIVSSGIFTSAGGPGEGYFSQIRHIPLSAVRLDKVEAVNQLSREIAAGQHTESEALELLTQISQMKKKPNLMRITASGLGCGGFCYLFGGSIADCLAAVVAGLALYSFLVYTEGKKLSKITVNIGGGAIATLCAYGLCQLGLGQDMGQVIIGSIMPLVPGVAFTNAIRDIADSDYLSGSVRILDALLVAFCIAGGVGLAFLIISRFLGGALL